MTRLLLVLACVLLLAVVLAGMRLGWRNRARRQAGLPALPAVPVELGQLRLPALSGVYVGTAFATSWQDRVVHAGLGVRCAATIALYDAGVLIDRDGADAIFIPAPDLVAARLAPGLVGKVVGEGGLLVVRWRLGGHELDSAVRADDKGTYPDWVRALTPASDGSRALTPASDGSRTRETADPPSLEPRTRHSAPVIEKGTRA